METGPLSGRDRRRLGSLDLHGLTVEEASSRVEERIDLALRAGLERLELIHGRSSGRIKAAVHRLLKDLTAVHHFEVDPSNPGATIVYFA
jgi:DNA mismatch repair protein MutS2